jgi:16S rRNA (cytidine1402-2'-O)-methyltransferase
MLILVPTPIGNLGDISFRILEVLKEGELILCEDTRVTKKLISLLSEKYKITFPQFSFISIHSHNEKAFVQKDQNLELLRTKNCIYMSDAGMPVLSDPGAILVDTCIQKEIDYDILPGANALLSAFAMSGFTNTQFTFYGFLPHKGTERSDQLYNIMESNILSILYESPHRLLKLLEEIMYLDPTRTVFMAKELTKKFQTIYKDKAETLFQKLSKDQIKGEWVVIIENKANSANGIITQSDISELSIPPKQKAKLLSKLTGKPTKEIYEELKNS